MSKLLIFLNLFLLSVFFPLPVLAGLAVKPDNISGEYWQQGGHYEKEIIVSRDDIQGDTVIALQLSAGEVEEWFSFSPGDEVSIQKGQGETSFIIGIDIPKDAPSNNYEGVIKLVSSPIDPDGGLTVVDSARLPISFEVVAESVSEVAVKSMRMEDVTDDGRLVMKVVINNKGLVIFPDSEVLIKLNIYNLNQEEMGQVLIAEMDEEIKPAEEKEITVDFTKDLVAGEYLGVGELYYKGILLHKEKMVLRVLRANGKTRITEPSVMVRGRIRVGWIVSCGIVLAVLAFVLARNYKKINTPFGKLTALLLYLSLTFTVVYFIAKYLPQDSEDIGFGQPENVSYRGAVDIKPVDFHPLKVEQDGRQMYRIYERPDFSSPSTFQDPEKVSFKVIEENSRWYRISVENRDTGWIAKSN